MRAALLVLLALLGAGCSTPATDAGDDADAAARPGVPLSTDPGLLLVDTASGKTVRLTNAGGPAWMSPGGRHVVWTEPGYSVHLNTTSGERHVVPTRGWSRLHDDGTGLVLEAGEARVLRIADGAVVSARAAPPAPARPVGGAGFWLWTSDDRGTWATEYAAPAGARRCSNAIRIQEATLEEHVGCHLRLAPDGTAAWSADGRVVVRERGGELRHASPADADNRSVSHENPVLVGGGEVVHLRVHGERVNEIHRQVEATEVVLPNGTVAAHLAGSERLALHDAAAGGQLLLLRVF